MEPAQAAALRVPPLLVDRIPSPLVRGARAVDHWGGSLEVELSRERRHVAADARRAAVAFKGGAAAATLRVTVRDAESAGAWEGGYACSS